MQKTSRPTADKDLTMSKPDSDTTETLSQRVEKIVEQIRPAVQSDGGDLELVAIRPDGVVEIRFQGACVNCPSAAMTLKLGIEKHLTEHIDEITEVIAVD